VVIETYVDGNGPSFVICSSCCRDGGEDNDDLTVRLVQAAGDFCDRNRVALPAPQVPWKISACMIFQETWPGVSDTLS
jgi:hypothetical protein